MAGAVSVKRVAYVAATAGLCTLLAGCTGVPVDDRPVVRIVEAAQPIPQPTAPEALAAVPLGGVLPTTPELSTVLGTGPNGLMGQLVEGDDDMLLRGVEDAAATPAECVSTAYRLQEAVYDSGHVRSVASSSWAGGGFDGPPVSGFFGVVQMASVADAQRFFAAITDQWRRCNGQTVALRQPGRGVEEVSRIADVVLDGQVVSASVLHASGGTAASGAARAMGLAGDCIVDVEIIDPRAAGGPGSATEVAELMLDKISSRR